jgi:hypothetical protein
MFLIPLGMMRGAQVSIADFLLKNLLPVTLGNIVGGALCVAAMYGSVYGSPSSIDEAMNSVRGGYSPSSTSTTSSSALNAIRTIKNVYASASTTSRRSSRLLPTRSLSSKIHLSEKTTGTDFLSPEALEKAKAGNMFEKVKLKKDGSALWTEVHEYAAAIRSGSINWCVPFL